MFTKILALSAVLAMSAAGLLPQPHYSTAAAVSSQSFVRHGQPHAVHAAPVAVHAAHLAYHAAPVTAYAAPARIASGHAVYSQNILRHDQPRAAYSIAPVAYAAPAISHAAPIITTAHQQAYPRYDFAYSMADGRSSDNMSHHESSDGDAAHGQYSLGTDGSMHTEQNNSDDDDR